MPLWIEITVLLMLTYATGIASGWLLWGRVPGKPHKGE